MSDEFRIIPYQVRSAGTDVPPEEVQAAINSLAQQTTIDLNILAGQAQSPTGPAGGDLGGTYPNPTVVGLHVTTGTESGVTVTGNTINSSPIGQTTPAAGAFTTLTATTAVGVASGGTGQNSLSAHNVLIGEGTAAVGFAAPGVTTGVPLVSNGSAVDPSFGTASVSGGGTGLATLTAFNVLVGNGTGNVALIAPGASGIPLTSRGAGTNPAFQGITVAGGGTGLVTIPAHGVLIGEGTSNVATAAPSTAGRALISAGATADPVFGFPTGALINIQVFTATGTYTPTTGTNSVVVSAVGAGGGGGGAAAAGVSQSAAGGGGGAGAIATALVTSAFSGVTVTIGTAGTAGTAGNNAGGTGGATAFGAIISCPGGLGGAGGAASGGAIIGNQILGGGAPTISGATALFTSNGNPAATSATVITAGTIQISGAGANSPFGAGGIGVTTNAAGNPGLGKGSGGSGGTCTASGAAVAGGAGTAGLVFVYEYA